MRSFTRGIILLVLACAAVFTVAISTSTRSNAQASEPKAIIDAALKDLSQKLGRPVSRTGNVTWTWEQTDFPDSSLGCPQPGKAYAQTVTRGFKVTLTLDGTAYDYRATNDGSVVFLCGGASAAPVNVTATPPTNAPPTTGPAATAIPAGPTAPTGAGQSVTYQKGLAYIGADNRVYVTAVGQGAGTQISVDTFDASNRVLLTYEQFRWSPDGTKLLYTELTTKTLYLAISGQAPIRVAAGLALLYPGAWSADGNEIAYAVETNQPQGDGIVRQVQAVPVTGNSVGQPRVAGSFVQGQGCGGAVFDPAEIAYSNEAGYGGNGLTLAWTTQGFVHSTTCTGVGLALTNPNGQILWSAPNVSRVAVSPDRTRAVGIQRNAQNSQLVMVDFSNGNVTALQAEANPDQVAWSADGSTILYSTATPGTIVKGQPSQLWNQLGLTDQPLDAQDYSVSLWRVAATGGPSTRLFQQQGRGIGVMSPAADNSGVALSFIPSSVELVKQVNSGASIAQVRSVTPRPQIYFVNWNGDAQSGLIAPAIRFSGQPAFSSGTFTAISSGAAALPDNVSNGSIAPPALVIGGQAVVITIKGETLNLRKDPTRSSPVLRILKPGAVVTVLAGPQTVEGFRWWQVRANDDNSVGWVVDQVTDQDGTNNMLAPQ